MSASKYTLLTLGSAALLLILPACDPGGGEAEGDKVAKADKEGGDKAGGDKTEEDADGEKAEENTDGEKAGEEQAAEDDSAEDDSAEGAEGEGAEEGGDLDPRVEKAAAVARDIEANPENADDVLARHELDREALDSLMYEIAKDPELSKAYQAQRAG